MSNGGASLEIRFTWLETGGRMFSGKLEADLTIEQGYQAARETGIELLLY